MKKQKITAEQAPLIIAIFHLEHMAKWIAAQNAGYSFEGLAEDLPRIKTALKQMQETEL